MGVKGSDQWYGFIIVSQSINQSICSLPRAAARSKTITQTHTVSRRLPYSATFNLVQQHGEVNFNILLPQTHTISLENRSSFFFCFFVFWKGG